MLGNLIGLVANRGLVGAIPPWSEISKMKEGRESPLEPAELDLLLALRFLLLAQVSILKIEDSSSQSQDACRQFPVDDKR